MNNLMHAFNSELLAASVRISIPILLAALGGLMVLRAGLYNIALEGQMLAGSFAAVATAVATGNSWLGVLAGVAAGTVSSLVYSLVVLHYGANDIVASIAVNLLMLGLTGFLVRTIYGSATIQPTDLKQLPTIRIPGVERIPVLGPMFSGQTAIVYLAFFIVALTYLMLFRTSFGLAVRMVGEHADAARTAGISPTRIRLLANTYSGMLCGLAGAHLSLGYALQFTDGMTQGRGFTAFSAAIFGHLSPVPVLLASLFFGFAQAFGDALQLVGVNINPQLVQVIPYLLTVVALTMSTGLRARGRAQLQRREVQQL
jgi:ABC-type uncharacterized transport system permease subunit